MKRAWMKRLALCYVSRSWNQARVQNRSAVCCLRTPGLGFFNLFGIFKTLFASCSCRWRQMSLWVIYSTNSCNNIDSFNNKTGVCVNHWSSHSTDIFKNIESYWIICSTDLYKTLIHSELKHVTVLMNESLNHWLNQFIQYIYSFRNEMCSCFNSWPIDHWLNQLKKCWFIQECYDVIKQCSDIQKCALY